MIDKSVENIEDVYAVSDISKGMIYHSLKDEGSNVYHNQMVFYLKDKDFSAALFEKAIGLMVGKHSMLRTGFKMDDVEEPIQIVYKNFKPDFLHRDISQMEKQRQENHIRRVLLEDRRESFDIFKVEPLWRVRTFLLDEENICFLWIGHHAIMDGWSSASLMTELHNTYLMVKTTPEFVPKPLKSTYKNFVVEQLVLKKQTEITGFWRKELDGYKPFHFGETRNGDNVRTGGKKKKREFRMDSKTVDKLRDTAIRYNTSMRNLCFAAYVYMLNMNSYDNDIVTGFIINNRPVCEDADKIIGCFLNTVPVRIKIPATLTWRGYITLVDAKIRELAKYNRLSFFEIIESLGDKKRNESPVVNTIFNFVDFFVMKDLSREILDVNFGAEGEGPLDIKSSGDSNTMFDFSVESTFGTFDITVTYSTGIDDDSVKRLAGYFKTILDKFVYTPHHPVKKDDLIPFEEKQTLLYEFNNTRTGYPKDKSIPRLFEEQVDRNPDGIALIGGSTCAFPGYNHHFTYARLNALSNRSARILGAGGVRRNAVAGLCMERSIEMIVAILAILKAGGAYLPIVPGTPVKRMLSMLDDGNASILLTEKSTADRYTIPSLQGAPRDRGKEDAPAGLSREILIFEELNDCLDGESLHNPENANGAADPAYIIFTSGSTGQPKGVLTMHYNVTRVVRDTNYIAVVPEDRILQLSNYAFDGSVFDIYGAFLNGASLVLIPPEKVAEADFLVDVIKREIVTVFFLTTALFNTLVDIRIDFLDMIRKVLFGGERVSAAHVKRALEYSGPNKIIHVYGPTETTVYASYYHVDHIDDGASTIPIGKPLANTVIYLMDNHRDIVPPGGIGELYIGGDGTARGYMNHHGLTGQKFVANPLIPGDRLYKTGDLGRRLPDGNIEFHGRIDEQVKVRGFRIEPAEIEMHLIAFEGIKEAIVITPRTGTTSYLCAYFVAGMDIPGSEIKNYLSERLPDYMIPSFFTRLEKMPLTPNGKVDRGALPEPPAAVESGYVAPRDEVEETLVEIWGDVLGKNGLPTSAIGIHDDFFEMGGHSLNATVIVSKIHKKLNVKIPLATLFERSEISKLADVIKTSGLYRFISIHPAEKKEYYIVSSAQRRIFILQQLNILNTNYNIPMAVTLTGVLDFIKLKDIFGKLIKRHESLRTSFRIINEEPAQFIQNRVDFDIESYETGDGFLRPFDLSRAPLLRVRAVRVDETKHVIMLDMHHIVTDGTSMGIILKEIAALYDGKELPGLKIDYKDYAEWQNSQIQKDAIREQFQYWLRNFEKEIPVLHLPVDYPRPLAQSFEGGCVRFEIGGAQTQRLRNLEIELGITPFMILLSVFTVLLAKLSGDEDIVVGTAAAGRGHENLQETVGMFVNMLALRNYPSRAKIFKAFLIETKERTLESFENRECPFEELVEKLSITRDAGHNPLFDVTFGFQNIDSHDLEIPGLEVSKYDLEYKIAKFDLSLNLLEIEDNLVFDLEYCTKLFKPGTIERFIEYFKTILSSILVSPSKTIAEIEIISEEEKRRVLYEYNDTGAPFPAGKTIHELFEAGVGKMPDQIAVTGPSVTAVLELPIQITYRELNRRADRLAEDLKQKGVRFDTIVGIMVVRSIEMIVGILGILKSGGAYLPIDPAYPRDRIDYILNDSAAALLLTGTELVNSTERKIAPSGILPPTVLRQPPTSPAYVIYTSGSTGKPKGVLVEHKGIANLSVFFREKFGITPRDRIIQFAGSSFDASVWEINMALLNRALLYVLTEETIGNYDYFCRYMALHQVTVATLPPEYAVNLEPGKLKSLRLLITAGSAPTVEMANKWKEKLIYVNAYGPTETTICATYETIGKSDLHNTVSIGKPLPNTQIYITDADMNPQPVGISGELCIAGVGVARGYLNKPGLTGETFVINSFLKGEGGKLYKSGDLARWLPGGKIEFLGRIDYQVKIRGFRIEPGEIEQQLLSHDGINASAVIVSDRNGENTICAYFTSHKKIETAELRNYLAKTLPNYMIPDYFNRIESMPLTTSRKIDRNALASMGHKNGAEIEFVAPQDETEKIVAAIWKEVLGVEQVGIYDNFFTIGGNSLKLIKLSTKLNAVLGSNIPPAKLFEHVTIDAFVRYFTGKEPAGSLPGRVVGPGTIPGIKESGKIAIIGMAGRFPGAGNVETFWNNLKNGIESIKFLTDEELREAGIGPGLINNPNYVKSMGGVLEDRDCFDAAFFDYSAPEAAIMDPQIRIFHECAWEVFENAGYNPYTCKDVIGVYGGASSSSSWEGLTYLSGKNETVGGFTASQLSNKDFLCTRIAYRLDLKGPAVNVQTTCSTSLVAVHMACQGILNGDCHMALAGGVSVSVEQPAGYLYQEGRISSPDGRCRAFDAGAKGTVSGNGAGIVLLKSLKSALADGDYIHAIIRGTGINNDGINKAGYSAPSVKGQAAAIQTALRMADVDPREISYVETHGTGTELGDPIEIEALSQAFNTGKKTYCAVGSVKTNIGHLDAAAGAAGLIKAVLALKNKRIPPSLNYKTPNPKIDFANSPFYVNAELREWKNENGPRLAGVSSFGIGGTNAHVILEEAPAPGKNTRPPGDKKSQLLLLSAKTPSALRRLSRDVAGYLIKNPLMNLADTAYTLQVGRQTFRHRLMAVCSDIAGAPAVLTSPDSGKSSIYDSKDRKKNPIFMFPGIGSQYVNMGRGIYHAFPLFRREIDRCFDILKSILGYDFKDILYPGKGAVSGGAHSPKPGDIGNTHNAQLAIFIVEYALAGLLLKWGIKPRAMVGYSLGEYTAACLSGVFSLEDALKILVARGRLTGRLPTGIMLSVPLPTKEVAPLLGDELSIAIDNGPSCIVAGPGNLLENFQEQLKEKRCLCIQLPNSHAIHSRMMDPILSEFEECLRDIKLNVPQIPYISNLTGTWISKQDAVDPRYWSGHLRETVRFADAVGLLKDEPDAVFIEIGPGRDLSTLLGRSTGENPGRRVVNLIRPLPQDIPDDYYLLNKVGKLWQYGLEIDWRGFNEGRERHRISLPSYPFEKKRFPIDENFFKEKNNIFSKGNAFRKNPDIAEWFYIPVWEQSFHPVCTPEDGPESFNWLIFSDETGFGSRIARHLLERKQHVAVVTAGEEFSPGSDFQFVINPRDRNQYDLLFDKILELKITPHRVLHLWNLSRDTDMDAAFGDMDNLLDAGFYSILYTVQALTGKGITRNIQFQVITGGIHNITGEEEINPLQATVLGPVKIIPLEYSNIRCCGVDILPPKPGSRREDKLIGELVGEFDRDFPDIMVAYRGTHRWVQKIKSHRLDTPGPNLQRLKEKGTYLVIGGFGGMGFSIAEHLALHFKAGLILVGRTKFPDRENWPHWLASHDKNDGVSVKIRKILELEESGARFMTVCADVGDEERMRTVVADAEESFGKIDGVLHTAGVVDNEGIIQRRTRAMNELSMNPKVRGTIVLHRIFKNRNPGFFVLFSSLGNFIYKIKFGQAGYNAANEFLDSFGQVDHPEGGTHLVTINWTDWREVGMGLKTILARAEKENKTPDLESELFHALLSVEGVEVFNRILGSGLKRVAVSSQDLHAGLEYMDTANFDDALVEEHDPQFRYQRPELITEYMPPATEMEKMLVETWAEFFGFQKIGIQDDFFELGGDSLKAITLLGKIHKKRDVKIPLMELFKHPTIETLAEFINTAEESRFVSIPAAEKREYYVLSSVQKKIFFAQQLDPRSTAYNMAIAAQLEGRPDEKRVETAFKRLSRRHECYRTSVEIIDDEPIQKIHDHVEFEVTRREGKTENIDGMITDFIRPYDLAGPPLARVSLVDMGDSGYLLMIDIHHIVSDAVSHGIMISEFLALYNGQNLPPLRIQYKDFSEWQNRLSTSGAMDKQRKYWLSRFEDRNGSLPDTFFDYPRPPVRNIDAGGLTNFLLNKELTKKIYMVMERTGVTLSIVLLAIYNILLYRYSKKEDIVIGVITTGRTHPDLEKLIGMFLNAFPLRSRPQRDKTFLQFLAEVKQDTLDAFENQDYHLDELVDELGIKAEGSRNLLFDAAFNLFNREQDEFKLGSAEVTLHQPVQEYAKFDLTLYANDVQGAVELWFRYSTQLFKQSTVEKFRDYYIEIAGQVIENVDIKLEDITFSHEYLIAEPKRKSEEDGEFVF